MIVACKLGFLMSLLMLCRYTPFLIANVAVFFCTLSIAATTDSTARPNILFIAMDDLNDWIGVLGGHPQTITPTLIAWPSPRVVYQRPLRGSLVQSFTECDLYGDLAAQERAV